MKVTQGAVIIALLLIVGLVVSLALPIEDQALKIAVALVEMGAGMVIGMVVTLMRRS